MFTLPIINVKADPLDALLAALGLRLQMLAKNKNNEAFNNLIKDRTVAIAFIAPQVARYYRFDNGHFGQAAGHIEDADLTIEFTNAMSGVKLLTKGDVAAFMTAIQDGEVIISGDYKLVLWFASIGKQAATLPEEYRGYVEQARPYIELTKPYAQTAKDALLSLKQKLGK